MLFRRLERPPYRPYVPEVVGGSDVLVACHRHQLVNGGLAELLEVCRRHVRPHPRPG